MSVGNKVRIVGIESFKAFKGEDGVTDSAVTIHDEEFYDDYFVVDTIGVGASNYFTAQAKKGLTGVKSFTGITTCLLYTSPSPRDMRRSRMPSSA